MAQFVIEVTAAGVSVDGVHVPYSKANGASDGESVNVAFRLNNAALSAMLPKWAEWKDVPASVRPRILDALKAHNVRKSEPKGLRYFNGAYLIERETDNGREVLARISDSVTTIPATASNPRVQPIAPSTDGVMVTCKGLTNAGARCRRGATQGEFCGLHVSQAPSAVKSNVTTASVPSDFKATPEVRNLADAATVMAAMPTIDYDALAAAMLKIAGK